MASWEPKKPAQKEFEVVSEQKYDQIVAELSEVLYSYLYQLHSSSENSSHSTNSRESLPTDVQPQKEYALCKA